jgi:hypothetical protein
MLYNPESENIPKGFGVTMEEWAKISEKYLQGTASECLDRILNGGEISERDKCIMLLEIGTRITLGELSDMKTKFEEYLKQQKNESAESVGEESPEV